MTRLLTLCFLLASLGVAAASTAETQVALDSGLYSQGQDTSGDRDPGDPAAPPHAIAETDLPCVGPARAVPPVAAALHRRPDTPRIRAPPVFTD